MEKWCFVTFKLPWPLYSYLSGCFILISAGYGWSTIHLVKDLGASGQLLAELWTKSACKMNYKIDRTITDREFDDWMGKVDWRWFEGELNIEGLAVAKQDSIWQVHKCKKTNTLVPSTSNNCLTSNTTHTLIA